MVDRVVHPSLSEHEYYVYRPNLTFLAGFRGIDILERLRATETFIVDNNLPWKRVAAIHTMKNFVLGCTISEEAENLQGMLFTDMPSNGYSNVYSVKAIYGPKPGVLFDRIEPSYAACFAKAIPPLSSTSPEHQQARQLAAASFRTHLAPFLAQGEEQLQGRLSEILKKCLNDYFVSAEAAVVITARHLKGCNERIRARKLDPCYLNLPGDSRLIAEALYYGFSILSNDVGDVHAMAAMAGISVRGDSELERCPSR